MTQQKPKLLAPLIDAVALGTILPAHMSGGSAMSLIRHGIRMSNGDVKCGIPVMKIALPTGWTVKEKGETIPHQEPRRYYSTPQWTLAIANPNGDELVFVYFNTYHHDAHVIAFTYAGEVPEPRCGKVHTARVA